MAKYVDCFIIPVPKKKMKEYQASAKKLAKLWIAAGALEYTEALAEDVTKGKITSFPRSVALKPSEVVSVGTITYRSKKHRNEVMEKAMSNPAVDEIFENMVFDGMRMIWGGFEAFISISKK